MVRDGDAYNLVNKLLKEGTPTSAIVARITPDGISSRTVLRWIKEIRSGNYKEPQPPKDKRPMTIVPSIEDMPQQLLAPAAKSIEDKPSAKIIAAAADMEKIRHAVMEPGEKQDYRIAIGAAQAEAQILMSAAKLAREMREASAENIVLHPQHAHFRRELLETIKGTEAEERVLTLFQLWGADQ